MGSPNIGHWARQWCWPTHLGVVSTPILDMLREAGYKVGFKLALSGTEVALVGYSFMDDIQLVQMGTSLTSSGSDVLPLMQAALTLWEQGLCAMGGTLVPDKSFWYLLVVVK